MSSGSRGSFTGSPLTVNDEIAHDPERDIAIIHFSRLCQSQAYVHTIRNECEHFVHECLGKGRAPLSTMADAATAMRMLAAAEASATDGVHVTL